MSWVSEIALGGWLAFALGLTSVLGVALLRRYLAVTRALRAELATAHSRLDETTQRDALTGLHTRAGLEPVLHAAVDKADRAGGQVCVVAIGLDNLPTIGEAFGQPAADAVVLEACARLAAAAPQAGSVGRIAPGEFAVVLVAEGDDPVRGRAMARRVLAELSRPIHIEGRDIGVVCSVGIALYPVHGARPRLVGKALTAMRHVRMAGGASFAEYLPSMETDLREQAELAADLRMALERHELSLVYQPKVDAASLQITAAEALLRWQHPVRGVVSPVVFIPIAERYGLISAIGNWVVQEAARQAAVWRDNGLRMRVAINVSGFQFRQDDFVPRLEAALRRHGLKASRFTCEITETVAMEDTRVTQEAFERLRRAGLHVSIDDFGTGHSSLASLRRLPAAELKIDRAFVADLDASRDAQAIAKAIVQMAHTLGLRVVAEGVETEAQRDRLIALGCDELQGYLFARPMTAAALGLWALGDDQSETPDFRESLFQETQPAEAWQ